MSRRSQVTKKERQSSALARAGRTLPESKSHAKTRKTSSTAWFGSRMDRATAQALGLAVLLFAVTIWVYFPVVHHPFVNYDDPDYVTDNARVQQGLTWTTVTWAFSTMESANWHPLTWLSHAVDCELFGLHPSGHHATSLLLHAVNAALLSFLLWTATRKLWRSLFVAGFFALHPINVESVAWVAERKSVLCMFFILVTLAAYGWYAKDRTIGRYLAVLLCFALALAAKPMAVTLPFALLLIDIWPLHRLSLKSWDSESALASERSLWELIREKLPLLAMTVASCVVTVIAQNWVIKPLQVVPMRARFVNAIYSYVAYVAKAFWPARLAVFYAQQGSRLAFWEVGLCVIFLAAVTSLAWRLRSRSYFLAGWLWFLGTLVPMIGLVQVGDQGMADRYAYLSFLGIFVAVVWGATDLAEHFGIDARWPAIAGAAALVAFSLKTRDQLRTWESNTALWTHSLQITPDNYVAHDLVGLAISHESFEQTGQACPDDAFAHFQTAISLNPTDTLGHLDAGYCELTRKNFEQAIAQYRSALQSAPNPYLKSRAYLNLGGAYQDEGDFPDSREAYRQALEIYPKDRDVLRDMARLDAREQIARLSKSATTKPSVDNYVQLGRAQQSAGLVDDARVSFQHALSLDPNSVAALNALRGLGVANR
jgi:protein O-mannosyl-transferase